METLSFKRIISKYIDAIIIVVAIISYGIHFIFFHGGYFGFDDIEYCRLADSFAKGTFDHSSLYAFRYATIIPLAFTYFLNGVSDLSNILTMLSVYILTLHLVLKSLTGLSPAGKWFTGLLMIVTPMHLMYIEKPMPDLIVECGFFISFLSYFSMRYNLNIISKPSFWFVVGVIIIFLAKETFLIFYPYFFGLLLLDIYHKKRLKYWRNIVAMLSVFIIFYFGIYFWTMNDPFARVQSIMDGQYISACAYDLQPFSVLLDRITFQLWNELVRNLYLFPLGFAFYLINNTDPKFKFIAGSFLVLLMLANFMTISYTSYVPLCPDPRHHMFILPFSAMLFGIGMSQTMTMNKRQIIFIVSVYIFLLLLSIYNDFENSWWLYLPVLAAIFAGYKGKSNWMIILVTIGLLSVYIQNITYNKKVNYADQKLLNEFAIYQNAGFKYIITDRVNYEYGQLHSGFDTSIVRIIDFKSLDTFVFKPDVPRYLILNGMTSYLSGTSWESLPEFVRTASEKLPKVFENKSGAVYKIN